MHFSLEQELWYWRQHEIIIALISRVIWYEKISLYYVASRYFFLSVMDAGSMISEWQLDQVDIIFSKTDCHVLIISTDRCLVKPLASLTRTLSYWWWPLHHVLSIIQAFCFLIVSYWEWRLQHLNLGDENIHCIIMYKKYSYRCTYTHVILIRMRNLFFI